MGPLGWQETVFIFILALLIFGPKKLPELGKTLGKALTEFRRASSELKATFDREMSSIERETDLKEVTSSYHQEITAATSSYDSSNHDYNYDSSYYYEGENQYSSSSDTTASDTSTVGASASQGAESTSGTAPEGTVATTLAAGEVAGTNGASSHSGKAQEAKSDASIDFQI